MNIWKELAAYYLCRLTVEAYAAMARAAYDFHTQIRDQYGLHSAVEQAAWDYYNVVNDEALAYAWRNGGWLSIRERLQVINSPLYERMALSTKG